MTGILVTILVSWLVIGFLFLPVFFNALDDLSDKSKDDVFYSLVIFTLPYIVLFYVLSFIISLIGKLVRFSIGYVLNSVVVIFNSVISFINSLGDELHS